VNRLSGRFVNATLYAVIVLMCPRWTLAHHSYAMFDDSRMAQVSGSVRTLEWMNPHVWLWLTVTDEKGASSDYAFEGNSIGEMMRRSGWTKNTVMPGDKIVVSYRPFKDGKNGGKLNKIMLPDGRSIEGG
jgi:hypothetical protein